MLISEHLTLTSYDIPINKNRNIGPNDISGLHNVSASLVDPPQPIQLSISSTDLAFQLLANLVYVELATQHKV